MIYIFDIDRTLTEHRQPMEREHADVFEDFIRRHPDYEKILPQLFQSATSRVLVHFESEVKLRVSNVSNRVDAGRVSLMRSVDVAAL